MSELASAQVAGYHAGGISSVAKHFPGHGDTGVDSHFGLPEVTHTLEQIEQIDLPPFKADIAAGVDTIMTAHVVMPADGPRRCPATMSHKILTGLLRDELGFDGLIVTDALDMAGATATYPPNVAPVQAMLAGADQLLVPPQMDVAYDAVLDAVRSGEISRQRLDESVYRILLHKFQPRPVRATRSSTRPRRRRSWVRRSTWPTRRRSPTAPRHWSRTTPACCRWRPARATFSWPAGA